MKQGDEVICPGCFGKGVIEDVTYEEVFIKCVDNGTTMNFPSPAIDQLKPWDEAVSAAMIRERDGDGLGFTGVALPLDLGEFVKSARGAFNAQRRPVVKEVWTMENKSQLRAVMSDGSIWDVNLKVRDVIDVATGETALPKWVQVGASVVWPDA